MYMLVFVNVCACVHVVAFNFCHVFWNRKKIFAHERHFHCIDIFVALSASLQNSANFKLLPLIRGNGRSQCEDHWIIWHTAKHQSL